MQYPPEFSRIVEQGLIHLTPWHLMTSTRVREDSKGLALRYPERELFPFAFRQDNDDVACWEKGEGAQVQIVHDFASPGWEHEGSFDNFWSWFRSAVEATIDWD